MLETVAAYRNAMRDFAGHEQPRRCGTRIWISRAWSRSTRRQFKTKVASRAEKAVAKARTRDSMSAFKKLTEVVDGKVQIVDQSPLIVPIEKLADGDDIGRGVRRAARC